MKARHELRPHRGIVRTQVEVGEQRLAETCQAFAVGAGRFVDVRRVAAQELETGEQRLGVADDRDVVLPIVRHRDLDAVGAELVRLRRCGQQ